MSTSVWAVGIDLGGTKVELAAVDSEGHLYDRVRRLTNVKAGPEAVQSEIVASVRDLLERRGSPPVGLGIGVEGWPEMVRQIDQGVRGKALPVATRSLQVLAARLGNDAGVVGAASLAIRSFAPCHQPHRP